MKARHAEVLKAVCKKAQGKYLAPEIKEHHEGYQPPTYAPDIAIPSKPFQLKVFELSWRSLPHPGDEARVEATKKGKAEFDRQAAVNNEALQIIRLQSGLQATAAELEQVLNDGREREAMPPSTMRPPKYPRHEQLGGDNDKIPRTVSQSTQY